MALAVFRSSSRVAWSARANLQRQAALVLGALENPLLSPQSEETSALGLCCERGTARPVDSGYASRSYFHTSSPLCAPTTSSENNGSAAELEEKRKAINKILYRSRQRGLLELDLLMGRWASENVPKMNGEAMEQYTQILEEENPDLWKWLTAQADAPADLKANPVFASLCAYVRKDIEAKSDPSTRTEPGRAWVRGWNDGDRKVGGPPSGNQ